MDKNPLANSLFELIDELKLPEVFEILQKRKDTFKDFQAFREKYMLDYSTYLTSQKSEFRKSLKVFITSCLQESSTQPQKEPDTKKNPNEKLNRNSKFLIPVWLIAILVLGLGGSVSILSGNRFGCDYNNSNNKTENNYNIDTTQKENKKEVQQFEVKKPVMEQEVLSVSSSAKSTKFIKKGNLINLRASGSMRVGKWVGNSTPEGKTSGVDGFPLEDYNLVADKNHAALLYRISPNDAWEAVVGIDEFEAAKDGVLEFLVNDKDVSNNSGAYKVVVKIIRP